MTYLLDTNVCIALIKNRPVSVRLRFNRELGAGSQMSVSSITAFELFYGIAKSTRRQTNDRSVTALLSAMGAPLVFDASDAKIAGQVRAVLEAAGTPIGTYDLLIAGQAVSLGLTLVTANEREFRRVKGLQWENWG
jgi:tRNA(fMet)-specific endonuclease VapC